MTDKTQAIREYASAKASLQGAEVDVAEAYQGVDAALSVLDDRLRDAMHSVLSEFEEEYGFQPAEIEVAMIETTQMASEWNEYELARVMDRY